MTAPMFIGAVFLSPHQTMIGVPRGGRSLLDFDGLDIFPSPRKQ